MKRLLLALPLILIASPALAERWMTAASIPYDGTPDSRMVDYLIDIHSIRKNGRFTSAQAKWSYSNERQNVIAECSNSRLTIDAGQVRPDPSSERPDPYSVKRKGKDWWFDSAPNKGEPFTGSKDPDRYIFNRWFSGALDLLCG